MIRNIEKRKELLQMVYVQYRQLTEEEKKEHDMEVGAAYDGYELALKDIAQIIVDGREDSEIVNAIVEFISHQFNGRNDKRPFRITECVTSEMKEHINTTMRAGLLASGLMKQGMEEEEADSICKVFIESPGARKSILGRYKIKGTHVCEKCGRVFAHKPMTMKSIGGIVTEYCSEECVLDTSNNF